MSTKINVRSPFYLNLSEPVQPVPAFTCDIANLKNFAVDNQGVITAPNISIGSILSYTSSDSGFANNKYATVSTAVTRTIVVTIIIPAGYTNSDDVYFTCSVSATQPISSSCTTSVTNQGTIPAQAVTVGGATVSVALAGYFNGETTYAVTNDIGTLVTTSLSGSTLTLSANSLGGSGTIYVEGRDASYPTTCAAVQPIAITITAAGNPAYDCASYAKLDSNGGSITTAGVITKPTPTAVISQMSLTSGGAPITSVAANSGSAAQDVTIFFSLTVPAGYSNAAATIICSKVFSQPGTTPVDFTCYIANLSKQNIAKNGSIYIGIAEVGTVKSFTTPTWSGTVSVDTVRAVQFQILIPSGYALADGTATINCSINLTQPATASTVGNHAVYLTKGVADKSTLCTAPYTTRTGFKSSVAVNTDTGSAVNQLGAKISYQNADFDGRGLWYGIAASVRDVGGVDTTNDFYILNIDNNGIVLEAFIFTCRVGGGVGQQL